QAVFRRDDSCVVVAAYDLSSDTLFARHAVTAALALAADERTFAISRDSGVVTGTRALATTAPCGPLVLSLEAVAPGERHVARARYGVTPPRRPPYHAGISDLLLFDPPDSLPATLDAVVPHERRREGIGWVEDRKSTRVNSSHVAISYAVFCLQKKNTRGV